MVRTWLTSAFGLSVPVISAPMAGVSGGALAAAVSAAGGLGMIGVNSSRDPEWIREEARVAGADGQPFGIGVLAWSLEIRPEQLEAVIASRPVLVSVSFGDYEPHIARLKSRGIAVTTQVGNMREVQRAVEAGVDFLVVRGAEGGGHGRNDVSTLPLLEAALDKTRCPVVAAGGIGGARGLAAVLAAGAAGAWAGTAFLACTEAANSHAARRVLLAATELDTVYGSVFDVAQRLPWPTGYGGRALRNSYFERWHNRLEELAIDDAAAKSLTRAREEDDFDTAYLYAGQGVGLLMCERSAADVVADFSAAEALLSSSQTG
jgi:nitronate monooxygenase